MMNSPSKRISFIRFLYLKQWLPILPLPTYDQYKFKHILFVKAAPQRTANTT